MELQLESLREQRPHRDHRRIRLPGHERLRLACQLGDDVEAIVAEPRRPADELELLKLIRLRDQKPRRHVRHVDAVAGQHLDQGAAVAGRVLLDAGDFERGVVLSRDQRNSAHEQQREHYVPHAGPPKTSHEATNNTKVHEVIHVQKWIFFVRLREFRVFVAS